MARTSTSEQADSRAVSFKAGDRVSALTAVFVKQGAQQMLADWQRCLAGSERVDATPRRGSAIYPKMRETKKDSASATMDF